VAVGQECILGLEFSGRAGDGRRVMGMVAARGLATSVEADPQFLWDVPRDWTLEQAATVPVAYATAYYALCVRGRMRRGEAVLVHAGSGGVGQAAIAIALAAGCDVFTTVGTADKRAFLRERFPALPDANVGNSRDTSFERLVLRRTRPRAQLAGRRQAARLRALPGRGRPLPRDRQARPLQQHAARKYHSFLSIHTYIRTLHIYLSRFLIIPDIVAEASRKPNFY
jgi:fatty acid synthase, animal type